MSRNVFRVGITALLVLMAKLIHDNEDIEGTFLLPDSISKDADLRQADNMPLVCEVLSVTDHILMATLMFYLAALSLYLF